MSQALFTVIGGSLVNLSQVTFIENSVASPGHVIVHFDNKEAVALDGSMQTVLASIGSGKDSSSKATPPNGRG